MHGFPPSGETGKGAITKITVEPPQRDGSTIYQTPSIPQGGIFWDTLEFR